MSWLFWAGVVTACGASYQLIVKMLAGQAPVYFITACVGAIVMLGSCIMLSQQSFSLSQVSTRTLAIIVLLGLVTFGIEIGYNFMYRAGAPLTYARMITTAGVGLVLLIAGTTLFSEKLSAYQILGVFVTILGLVLLSLKGNPA